MSVTELPFVRVLTRPRSDDEQNPQPLRRLILSGLLDAAIRGRTVASLWLRPEPHAPLQVLIARDRVLPSQQDGTGPRGRPLPFPLGTTGQPVERDQVAKLLSGFGFWTACTADFEPLLSDVEDERGRAEARWTAAPLDELVGYLSHEAFAWLVIGHPAPPAATADQLEQLRRELFRLRQSGQLSEADVIALERQQGWFRELSRAGPNGMWHMTIAVGTPYELAQAPLTAMFCAAAEHAVSDYKFRPIPDGTFSAVDETLSVLDEHSSYSFAATADLAAALIRPPETEVPGIQAVTPSSFDVSLDEAGVSHRTDSFPLARVLDRHLRAAGVIEVSRDGLNRHTFVCGATGAGKSQSVRALLETLTKAEYPVPWLVIEPAKAEYARMAGRIKDVADVLVIAPGDRDAPPASINPLEPASLEAGNPDRGFPLQSHADLIRELFLAAFQAEEPFPQVLSQALTECYAQAGWDLVTSDPDTTWFAATGQPVAGVGSRTVPRYPSLSDVQRTARSVVDAIGYAEDIKRNVRGFVDVRLGSLRTGTPGRLFEGGHPVDFAELLRRNVVIEMEAITNDQDKAFVIGVLLIRLYEQLLLEEKERFARTGTPARLRHVTVIEEAHRLLKNLPESSPAAHSIDLFASLLAEVRAYGEGIVIAEQIPTKIIPDVIKNTALKVVHRLPAADDRDALGATMNLSDDQSQYLVTLLPGTAAVFLDGMDHPILAAMPLGEAAESAVEAQRVPPLAEGRRRSVTCEGPCKMGVPCSLGAIRRAEQTLDVSPALTFWMEISFAAHGVGFRAPGLSRTYYTEQLRALAGTDSRAVRCAISHAAERALASRYTAMREYFDPHSLAVHLAGIAWSYLGGTATGEECIDDYGRWRVGCQRFADLLPSSADPGSSRPALDPSEIRARAAERGVDLASDDPAEQARQLRALPWLRVRDARQRALLAGRDSPPWLLRAAADIAGPGAPSEQILLASQRTLIWPDLRTPQTLLTQLTYKL